MQGLTISQAAQKAGVTTQRIHQLAQEGKIRFTQTPLGRLFSEKDVEEFWLEREARKTRSA